MWLREFLDNASAAETIPFAPDQRPGRFHRSMPGYRSSELAQAPGVAAHLGLETLHVKLETERFGLPSFKILGASWAICRALSRRAGLDEPAQSFVDLHALASSLDGRLTLVAATDGNHGRAVARMAGLLGLGARILVPEGTAAARVEAIAAERAAVEIVRGTYDDAVGVGARLADEQHLVISDTSWPGYEEVPHWVADGYATIFEELAEQLAQAPPLVVVQIGVGALASATVRALAAPERAIVGVEPDGADCMLQAVRAGAPVRVPGPHRSVMAGLNCGMASQVALPDIAAGVSAFCAIDDGAAEQAVRMLLSDGLVCGETGASGVAGLLALRQWWTEDTWERLGVASKRPAALALCTESPTDPVSFARIVAA